MKLFRRKNTDNTTPTEVQDYYQATQSERKGIAWLLAFVTFAVTLIVILGLFFGGKWLYSKITDRNKDTSSEVAKPQADTSNAETDKPNETSSGSSDEGSGNENSEDQNVSGEADVPQTSSTRTDTPSPSQTPNTGPSELINTGEDAVY